MQEIEIIANEIKKIILDIVSMTEINRKETGTSIIADYVRTYTGVPKERKAASFTAYK